MVVEELRVVGEQGMTSSSRWHRSRTSSAQRRRRGERRTAWSFSHFERCSSEPKLVAGAGLGSTLTRWSAQARDLAESLQRRGVSTRDSRGKPADEVVFRVEGNRAILARTPGFLTLASSISVPAAKRNTAWTEVIRRTRAARASSRR
jgi:hypothetical protein